MLAWRYTFVQFAPLPHYYLLLCCPSGLLRAKGLVWLQERRSHRFVLHLSGRNRAECCMEETWDSPPMTQLVSTKW